MTRLADFAEELADLDDEEKLEFLIELSEELPPLTPERATVPPPAACRVQECQTAVYLWVDIVDDRVQVQAYVAKNSPTVRGLVTLVLQAINGLTTAEVLQLPGDLLPGLGLQRALGMTRQQGLRGVMTRVHEEVQRQKSARP